MKPNILIVLAAFALPPMAGQAQERLTCEKYMLMEAEQKLAALEGVKTQLLEAGQGFHFEEGASDAEKLSYVESACTDADSWPGLALFDVLGK